MVTIASLWLPILLSAVLVWIASAIVWMALPHHKTDWKPLPDEEALRSALNAQQTGTGQFLVPFAASQAATKDPEYTRKRNEGPVGFLTLTPPGAEGMGGKMAGSFVYYLVVGVMVAYLAGRTLGPGTQYLAVFRIVSTTAWLAYAFAIVPESIWFGRPWSTTIKHMADGLAYALITAGTFGWLWPSA
jgi:hypothetical protein